MSEDVLPEFVKAATLARIWDITTERVRQLAKAGHIPAGERGTYPFEETLRAYAKYQRQVALDARGDGKTERVKEARAREIELRIAEKEKRVIGREEHLVVIQKGIGALRNEISGVPAALTRDRDLKHHCEDLLNGAFKRAADFLDEECRRLEVDSRSLSAKRGGRARSMGKGKSDIPRK